MQSTPLTTYLALITVMLLWGSAFSGIGTALQAYSPTHLALLRFMIASMVPIVLLPIVKLRLPRFQDIPLFMVLGLVGIACYHTLLAIGQLTITAGAASFIIALAPVFTIVVAAFSLKETLHRVKVIGLLISLCGVLFISLGEGDAFALDIGALYVLLAAISASIFIVLQKSLLSRYHPFEITAYTLWFGTCFMLPFSSGLLDAITLAPLSTTIVIIYLGIFPSAISYLLWAYAMARTTASQAASFLYLQPIFGVIIAWLWLSEVPTLLTLIGSGLALTGLWVLNSSHHTPATLPNKSCA